jgi:hypothetical protein
MSKNNKKSDLKKILENEIKKFSKKIDKKS